MQERYENIQNSMNLRPRSISSTGIAQKVTRSRAELSKELDFPSPVIARMWGMLALIKKVDHSVEEGFCGEMSL
jgi:hypothetical protein